MVTPGDHRPMNDPGPTKIRVTTAVTLALALAGAGSIGSAQALTVWPVPGSVIAEFDPPDPDWLPGHRGVDLSARLGEPVRSPRAGVVQFAGDVAGTPIVVVAHGVVLATYLPVTTTAQVGQAVAAGDVIAEVASGTHCQVECLHWGARTHDRYVDPRILLGQYRVVLTPPTD